jgi:phenylacetate-CoA ligase
MISIKQKIYNNSPSTLKNILATLYNFRLKKWHGKKYYDSIKKYKKMFFTKSKEEIEEAQEKRFLKFIEFVKKNNEYYKDKLKNIEINSIDDIKKIPILEKNDLRNPKIISNIDDKLIVNFTGGTTGISLKNYYTIDDFQERQGNLDFFRGMYGYKFGSKTAWFSGKDLLSTKDILKNIFWVKDYLNYITYYSTFHMKKDYIDYMIEDMNKSQTEFFVGFPSAIYAIAYRIKDKKTKISFKLKAIFPTSEPLLEHQKALLEEVFNCPIPDQYASSEGAPFIYECPSGNLHYDMYSGIFEKRYPNSDSNEVLVTAFPTHSMPLIRYAIGDSVEFNNLEKKCSCGSQMPLVKKIEGRKMTFVYSKERGVIGAGNISNIVKYTPGIEKIQLIQSDKENILIKIVTSSNDHNNIANILEQEMRNRLGDKINIMFEFVDEIPNEKNGKFIMIKNSLSLDECV